MGMAERSLKPWVIQKYGGTSIGKLLTTITGDIIPEYLKSHNVALVCSARSGTSKSQGTTSLLLSAIRLATSERLKDTAGVDEAIEQLQEEHLQAAADAIVSCEGDHLLNDISIAIRKDCEQVRALLTATRTLGEISERTQDRVLAVGETLSCRIVAGSLRSKNIPANVIILNDIVEASFGSDHRELSRACKANPSSFLRGLTGIICEKISACKGTVPVITGFFGSMPDSLIHSVGRGYSDLCAALCAVALDAQELQIWKEVDGIFTADPRKIKAARLLATVTSEEASELTYYGSEVIHPLTIEQIDTAAIPLRLKNVMNPRGTGTIIYPSKSTPRSSGKNSPTPGSLRSSDPSKDIVQSNFMVANGYHGEALSRRTPTAVTVKEGVTVLNVKSNGTSSPQTFLARVGEALERNHIAIDLTTSSQQMLSLAVCSKSENITKVTKALSHLGTATAVSHMSIISVVGHKMRNMVGVAGEIFNALAEARVNIYMISQGASEINISFVVRAHDALLAMQVVHANVMRIPLHSERENSFIRGPWLY